jgi:hypothetical protein
LVEFGYPDCQYSTLGCYCDCGHDYIGHYPKTQKGVNMDWLNELDERQRKEVAFACVYRDHYAHGTDGHNRLLLIAKLFDLLCQLSPVSGKVAEKESGQ